MKDPLSNLKAAMDKTVFNEVTFSDQQKNRTLDLIETIDDQQLELFILSALHQTDQTGYDLICWFEKEPQLQPLLNDEGRLYIILHQLEQKQWIGSTWTSEKRPIKIYHLNKLGKKQLSMTKKETDDVLSHNAWQLNFKGGW